MAKKKEVKQYLTVAEFAKKEKVNIDAIYKRIERKTLQCETKYGRILIKV